MRNKIVLDLETQNLFEDVGGRGKNHLLKVSVCGIYEYTTDKYSVYEEQELHKLASKLEVCDQIIGFNIKGFDFEVLQPYLNFDIFKVPALDILEEITKVLGKRLSLETVAMGTLGSGKSGDGKQAVTFWRSGRLEQLKKYCLDDVKVTKQVYDYALKHQKLLYKDYFNMRELPIKITEAEQRTGIKQQGSLF